MAKIESGQSQCCLPYRKNMSHRRIDLTEPLDRNSYQLDLTPFHHKAEATCTKDGLVLTVSNITLLCHLNSGPCERLPCQGAVQKIEKTHTTIKLGPLGIVRVPDTT